MALEYIKAPKRVRRAPTITEAAISPKWLQRSNMGRNSKKEKGIILSGYLLLSGCCCN